MKKDVITKPKPKGNTKIQKKKKKPGKGDAKEV